MTALLPDWHARARALTLTTSCLYAGAFRDAASCETFDTFNPATGAVLARLPACGKEDVDRAVSSARKAFESGIWADQAPSARKALLLKWADLIERDSDHLALVESLETGKPIHDTLTIDLPATLRCLRWFAEAIDKIYDEIAPTAANTLAMIRRVPLGVVAAIVPWNFPLVMAITKVAPALAAGNSVILKPSELSSLSALHLALLAQEAGLPDGVFSVLTGNGPETGRALALHMDVAGLAFTGSTAVGKQLMAYAAQSNLKKVSLECGGKSANIVFGDVPDIEHCARMAADGIFQNMGQICNAGSRLLLDARLHDVFVEKLQAEAARRVPGDPLDQATRFGTMISPAHAMRVHGFISTAETEGATRVTPVPSVGMSKAVVPPTIFTNVNNDMTIAREEIFGPVLSVIRFESEEEAIRIANDSPYGLASAIWTANVPRALRLERKLNTGVVWINTIRTGDISLPFGGMKQSGLGRDKSLHGFDEVSALKSVWLNLGEA